MYYLQRQTQRQKFKRNVHEQTNVVENDCGLTSTHRQLLKFKTLEDILYLAKRLFQREPEVNIIGIFLYRQNWNSGGQSVYCLLKT